MDNNTIAVSMGNFINAATSRIVVIKLKNAALLLNILYSQK